VTGLILGAIVGLILVAVSAYQPRRRNDNRNAQEGP
jgi:hypothetical protein